MMRRRTIASAVIAFALISVSLVCALAQAAPPNTSVDAKQSDKVLFERAMKAMNSSNYPVARTLLETLIDSYPGSDYVPSAKVSIGDAWYAEGSFKQAELEYRDFVTFFPNRPEVAKVHLKIDSIEKSKNLR
jgi:outer membrane protein assembly factor BamD